MQINQTPNLTRPIMFFCQPEFAWREAQMDGEVRRLAGILYVHFAFSSRTAIESFHFPLTSPEHFQATSDSGLGLGY